MDKTPLSVSFLALYHKKKIITRQFLKLTPQKLYFLSFLFLFDNWY